VAKAAKTFVSARRRCRSSAASAQASAVLPWALHPVSAVTPVSLRGFPERPTVKLFD